MGNNTLFFKCSQREDMKFMKRTLCDIKRNKTKAELKKQGYGFDAGFCPGCEGPIQNITQPERKKELSGINKPLIFNKKESIRLYGFEIKSIEKIGQYYFMNFIGENEKPICQPLRLETRNGVDNYLEKLRIEKDEPKKKINTGDINITVDKMREKRKDLIKQREVIERDIMALEDCIKMFE